VPHIAIISDGASCAGAEGRVVTSPGFEAAYLRGRAGANPRAAPAA